MSTLFHPKTDGSSERSNKTMIEALRHYLNLRHTDWADHLIHVEVAMNNSVNATTGKSPTEMVFGSTLHLFPSPRDLAKPTHDVPAVSDYIQAIQDNVALARDRHAEAKTKQTTYANNVLSPNTRRGTKRIWRRRIYASGSIKKGGVQSFILAMLAHLRSLKQSQRPRITHSNCQTNTGSILRSMLIVSNKHMKTTLFYFPDEFHLSHPLSTPKTTSTLWRPSSTTILIEGSVSSWFIGKGTRI